MCTISITNAEKTIRSLGNVKTFIAISNQHLTRNTEHSDNSIRLLSNKQLPSNFEIFPSFLFLLLFRISVLQNFASWISSFVGMIAIFCFSVEKRRCEALRTFSKHSNDISNKKYVTRALEWLYPPSLSQTNFMVPHSFYFVRFVHYCYQSEIEWNFEMQYDTYTDRNRICWMLKYIFGDQISISMAWLRSDRIYLFAVVGKIVIITKGWVYVAAAVATVYVWHVTSELSYGWKMLIFQFKLIRYSYIQIECANRFVTYYSVCIRQQHKSSSYP